MSFRAATRAAVNRFEALTGRAHDDWEGIERLVEDNVPESTTLDYKRVPYNDPQVDKAKQKDEVRKDVAAFANAEGGVIVLGVTDKEGSPGTIQPFAGLDRTEGDLRGVIRSKLDPPVDGIQIIPVVKPGTNEGCLLIVVPVSAKAPHAFHPDEDGDALKYPQRVGRHTHYLVASQVRDLHLAQFGAQQRRIGRMNEVLTDLRAALHQGGWLLLTLVPEQAAARSVDRDQIAEAQTWWDQRPCLELLPPHTLGVAEARAGSHRICFVHRNGTTSMPSEVYAELHDDGSVALAVELDDAPGGNPSFFLDHLVAAVLDGLTVIGDLCTRAEVSGVATLKAALFFPAKPGQEIQAWDLSWATHTKLDVQTKTVESSHTVDLGQFVDARGLVALTGEVAGDIAHHFGAADALYLSKSGAVRIHNYGARVRDHQVKPRARELGIEIDERM